MEDIQPEVRMGAAKVLNGLLHCQFIPEPTDLLVSYFVHGGPNLIEFGVLEN